MKSYPHLNGIALNDELCEIEQFDFPQDDPSRRQRKILRKMYTLEDIKPKTINQKSVFDHWYNGKNLMLYGSAGSGKTFLAIYLALKSLQQGEFEKIYIIRSAVSSRDVGFLPGTLAEKMSMYELPYRETFKSLTGRGDVYDKLGEKDYYYFMSTSYVRGINIDNAIIILDEAQNCSFHEIDGIMTRVGENSKIIVCGDTAQNDLQMHRRGSSGMEDMIKVAHKLESLFGCIRFGIEDIVRSGFVKNYLLAKMSLDIV